ncbi:MAG: exosortase/archaeosortase family protein [Cyanobium sp.]
MKFRPAWLAGWLRDWLKKQWQRIPPPTPRNLWLLLAAAVATQSVAVFTSSQDAQIGVFALLVWGGALICMEDQLESLEPRPSRAGLVLGSLVLLWVLARTARILFWEGILYPLAPLTGLALALLILPPRRLGQLRESLLCLCLLPAFPALMRLIPDEPLSMLTARMAGFWVGILGLETNVSGRSVMVPGGGVTVLAACNGLDMIAQIICVCVIFLMAFPIRSLLSRLLVLLAAPLIGLFANTLRIALLALITTSGEGKEGMWFDFFHEEMGSLVFSGVAVFVFGMVYMQLLERELPPLPPGEA